MLKSLSVLLLLTSLGNRLNAPCDRILGVWSSNDKDLTVEIFKEDNKFKAKITWFDDSDDKSRPMASRLDDRNPDPALKNRKIIGMEVLKNLTYNSGTNRWEDGLIYDAHNGKIWNACLYFDTKGLLMVRGYWHFKLIGQTLIFKRITTIESREISATELVK